MRSKLFSLCLYVNGKVAVNTLDKTNYISTENMLPNKGGVERASVLPSVQYTQAYSKGDVLVSNIRPYFKKIWQAEFDGGCSNDVLVFRANGGCDPTFLYYVLANDAFFDYATATSKGTKMPRGDKTAIMQYVVPDFDKDTQKRISGLLRCLDKQIATNKKINDNLEQQAATVFKEWLSRCTGSASIGELSNNILDYTPISKEMVRLLNSSDVTEGVFPVAPLVPNKNLKGHFKKRFKYDDILYSEIRPKNHHYGYVLFDASEYIASTRLMVIRANKNTVSPVLLYQYLLLPEVEAEFTLKTESRSGTFPQGNYADMASIVVPYSSIESQSEVSAFLSQIRMSISHNQLENQRLEQLRDALLPKLMSGEIDVSDVKL